jgi:hypothetical protein
MALSQITTCSNPIGRTQEDIFEQMVKFTLSEKYSEMERLIEGLIEKPEVSRKKLKAA